MRSEEVSCLDAIGIYLLLRAAYGSALPDDESFKLPLPSIVASFAQNTAVPCFLSLSGGRRIVYIYTQIH